LPHQSCLRCITLLKAIYSGGLFLGIQA